MSDISFFNIQNIFIFIAHINELFLNKFDHMSGLKIYLLLLYCNVSKILCLFMFIIQIALLNFMYRHIIVKFK